MATKTRSDRLLPANSKAIQKAVKASTGQSRRVPDRRRARARAARAAERHGHLVLPLRC